ncbi:MULTISPECIES: ABC transporter ATP-binding protein [unclassified Beijerinckia]|uniref:ABC transporter ATP-binding protein n=1 Tax=unclassified Beijerinckia TaxID=2638183 RepID=UPI00089B04DE|nr:MULTISPECIES: ABC transporter ATP-binding protein [unclassified Beijerinckia]MDH7799367.1 molybdate transport system ATP-binding protein [Beijerinckia sp. GAS462]SED47827.1 molybdate transport system ATP-binding protein [Beijerinckia sp. 28-YEA-48]
MAEYSDSVDADGPSSWLAFTAGLALTGPAGPFHLDVALQFARGAFVALTGPSGAGKTTLLRVLAGLAVPDRGHVRVGGEMWSDTVSGRFMPVRRRPIGFVFQDYALFPNMTVRGNVEYALGTAHRKEAQALLELVGLERLAEAYPARLSGGQKQRLALIRALARKPSVLMLDEPLSALDPDMRRQLQDELKRLHHRFGTTTFLVSHDTAEILRLADRVVRLEQGRVVYDGDAAGAFGLARQESGLQLTGCHVSGPDAEGFCVVMIGDERHRIRYRDRSAAFAPGDLVMLDFTDAASTRVE